MLRWQWIEDTGGDWCWRPGSCQDVVLKKKKKKILEHNTQYVNVQTVAKV